MASPPPSQKFNEIAHSRDLLLRAIVLPWPEAQRAWSAWQEAYSLATIGDYGSTRLLPLIYERFRSQGGRHEVQEIEQHYVRALANLSLQLGTFGDIARALNRLGMPVRVLKGAAILSLGGPRCAVRVMSDIDIYTPRAQLVETIRVFREQGWQVSDPTEAELKYYFEVVAQRPDLAIDLHWHTIWEMLDEKFDQLFWQDSGEGTLAGAAVEVPCATSLLFHVLLGGKRDILRSWHSVVDAQCLLNNFDVSWEKFIELCRCSETVRPTLLMLQKLGKYGIEIPESVYRHLGNMHFTACEHLERLADNVEWLRRPCSEMARFLRYDRLETEQQRFVRFLNYLKHRWSLRGKRS